MLARGTQGLRLGDLGTLGSRTRRRAERTCAVDEVVAGRAGRRDALACLADTRSACGGEAAHVACGAAVLHVRLVVGGDTLVVDQGEASDADRDEALAVRADLRLGPRNLAEDADAAAVVDVGVGRPAEAVGRIEDVAGVAA